MFGEMRLGYTDFMNNSHHYNLACQASPAPIAGARHRINGCRSRWLHYIHSDHFISGLLTKQTLGWWTSPVAPVGPLVVVACTTLTDV